MSTFNKAMEGTRLVIAPEGVVNASNSGEFQDVINESLAQASEIVFDFADLTYISSAGLRVLLATVKGAGKPGAVRVINAADEIKELLTVTKLSMFMTIE